MKDKNRTIDMNTILNPVRMRIIQSLITKKNITTNELSESMNDIPKTTLYRHVRILIDSDILSVVSEKKIRGSVERTLALNLSSLTDLSTPENAVKNTFGFLMNIYARFEKYLTENKDNLAKQKVFCSNSVMMMSDEEFDSYLMEMNALFQKYNLESTENRKARDISIISSPVEES